MAKPLMFGLLFAGFGALVMWIIAPKESKQTKSYYAIRTGHIQPLRQNLRVSLVFALLMCFFVAVDRDMPRWILGLFAFNLVINVLSITSYFRRRHYFDHEGITFGRDFNNKIRLEWNEVTAVEFSKVNHAFVFKSGHGSGQVTTLFAGVIELAEVMQEKLPKAIFSPLASAKLAEVLSAERIVPAETNEPVQTWKGELGAELKKSFGKPALRRHSIFIGLMMAGAVASIEGVDFATSHGLRNRVAIITIAVLGIGVPGYVATRLLKDDEVFGKRLDGKSGAAMVVMMLGPIATICLIEGQYIWAGAISTACFVLALAAWRSKKAVSPEESPLSGMTLQ